MRSTARALAFALVAALAFGCSDDDTTKADTGTTANDTGTTGNDAGTTIDTGTTVDTGGTKVDSAAAKCTGQELCKYTVDNKCAALTMSQCLQFYNPAKTTCKSKAGLAAYVACNCKCLPSTAGKCRTYFSCGTTCFNTHCK